MGYYGTGDFYRGGRGDFYRGSQGDPGLFSFLGGLGKAILPAAAPILGGMLGGPVGAAVGGFAGGALSGLLGGGTGAAAATAPGIGGTSLMVSPGQALARRALPAMVPALGAAAGTLVTRGVAGSFQAMRAAGRKYKAMMVGPRGFRRRRRLNPLNPKALRRALRRAKGFEHFAKGVLRITRPGKTKVHFKFPRKRRKTV